MTTYKEMVYMVLDELKVSSDDSFYQEEHVLFLLDKYRTLLLKQRYSDIRKEVPDSNYQTICVNLEEVNGVDGIECVGDRYLRSIEEVPYMMTIGSKRVSSMDLFSGNFTYVSNDRFKYVGNNPRLSNEIYTTIANSHLYAKSSNPQAYYIEKVKITGIFEDSAKAAELSCESDDSSETKCDIMDKEFPLEEALIPVLIDMIVKALGAVIYNPEDDNNNASDDMSNLANFLARHLKKRTQPKDDDLS